MKFRLGIAVIAVCTIVCAIPINISEDASTNQPFVYNLDLKAHKEWYLGAAGDTNVSAVCTADLDNDGRIEIISAGYCADAANLDYPVGELRVWQYDGFDIVLLAEAHWRLPRHYATPTWADDVAVADVDSDNTLEIITVGATKDGTGESNPMYAQFRIWTYSSGTLTLEFEDISVRGCLSAVYIANIDFDAQLEIVVTDTLAGLFVCKYTAGTMQMNRTYWSSGNFFTAATDVCAIDIDYDNVVEIITAGYFVDQDAPNYKMIWHGELKVWNFLGGSFNLEASTSWTDNPGTPYHIGGNYVEGLAVVDADANGDFEIITAGYRVVSGIVWINPQAELISWHFNGWSLTRVADKHWRTNNRYTYLNAVTFGNIDTENDIELLTAGYYNATNFDLGLLNTFCYSTAFSQEAETFWGPLLPGLGCTVAYDVAVADADANGVPDIIVGGGVVNQSAFTNQLTIWNVQNYLPPQNTISGTVRDSAYNPLCNVTVTDGTRTTTTLPDGTYKIVNVPGGTYTVRAAKPGYTTASKTVTLTGTGNAINVDFVLSKLPLQNGNITGTVTDTSGMRVDGATVVVYYNATTTQVKNTITAATGTYSISNVPPVKYDIECFKGGYKTKMKYGVTVPSGGTVTVDFVLEAEPATITGFVTDAVTGNGISGASVAADTVYSAVTGSDGSYTIANVAAPASYTVNVSATGYVSASKTVSVNPGTTANVDFQLTPISRTGSLEGYVTDASTTNPIQGAYIKVDTAYSATTNAQGYYTISNIPEGTYNVEATATNYQSLTQPVSITAGQTSRLNFALSPIPKPTTGWLEGYVTDAATNAPIANANVELVSVGTTSTASNGYYNFSNVPEGSYELKFTATGYAGETRSVTISAGVVSRVNVALQPLPRPTTGWLEGYVTDAATNAPIANANVELVSISTTSTASNGYYNFSNVPEGSYELKFAATGYVSETRHVTILAGEVTILNIMLSRQEGPPPPTTGWLEGYVKDAQTKHAIVGVTITILNTVHSATTDQEGYYNISDITPATYSVRASATGYEDATKEVVIIAGVAKKLDFELHRKTEQPPPIEGWLLCTVRDVKTNDPIPGATIKVFKDGALIKTETTDENGFCNISLPAGNYLINVTKEHCSAVERGIVIKAGQPCITTIYLEAAKKKEEVENLLWYGVAAVIALIIVMLIIFFVRRSRKRGFEPPLRADQR